jgi:hypothetical protein
MAHCEKPRFRHALKTVSKSHDNFPEGNPLNHGSAKLAKNFTTADDQKKMLCIVHHRWPLL